MDTAGRSPQDQLKLNELRGFLEAARPDETHLVLSSTSTTSAMRAAVDRFSPLGVNRVILTKLDEAVSFGVILEVVKRVNASISYVTTGQDVPEDIEVSEANRLARWIIDRSIASGDERTTTPPAGTAGRLEVTVDDSVDAGAPRGQEVGADA
jgi:flagellar biosynthesis protein FlhF